MTIRTLQPSDVPVLSAMAERSGYPYPDFSDPLVEAVIVVADENDQPLMAVAAKRLVELYLWCGKSTTPSESIAALRLLHEGMAEMLTAKGYHGAEAYLPENVSRKFGRRLEKTFGWVRNWQSWTRRF